MDGRNIRHFEALAACGDDLQDGILAEARGLMVRHPESCHRLGRLVSQMKGPGSARGKKVVVLQHVYYYVSLRGMLTDMIVSEITESLVTMHWLPSSSRRQAQEQTTALTN